MRTFIFLLCLTLTLTSVSAAFAASGHRRVTLGQTIYQQTSQRENQMVSVYELEAKNETGVRAASSFTIEVSKQPAVTPDQWKAKMVATLSATPQCTVSTTADGVVIYILRGPNMVEYDFWKFGLAKNGAVVCNGVAWHFIGAQAEDEFQKFSVAGGKDAYDAFAKMAVAE